jgi:predicted nucleic acid-binding protein
MEIETYYLDTYALYEIIAGNPAYKKYTTGIAITTTRLNLMELYYGLLANHNKETAEKHYNELTKYAIEPDDNTIKKAMQFRHANKDKNLSYTDCIGYTLAQQRKTKFLTGDKAFKNMPDVEYVK